MPHPSSASYPSVAGHWTGYYSYGAAYGPQLEGTRVPFRFTLIDGLDGHFTGTCTDQETLLVQRTATLEGHIDHQRIIFTKEYPVAHFIEADGTHITDHEAPGFGILYKGHWDEDLAQFRGTWKIVIPEGEPDEPVSSGEWMMEHGTALSAATADEGQRFTVQYAPEHLWPIYFADHTDTIVFHPQHRVTSILMGIFIIVGIVSGVLAARDPHPGFVVLLTGCVLFALALGILLGKSISSIRNWKQQVEAQIDVLCSVGAFTLVVTDDYIMQQTPATTTLLHWKQITGSRLTAGHIVLESANSQWVYPKASMEENTFGELVMLVRKYCPHN